MTISRTLHSIKLSFPFVVTKYSSECCDYCVGGLEIRGVSTGTNRSDLRSSFFTRFYPAPKFWIPQRKTTNNLHNITLASHINIPFRLLPIWRLRHYQRYRISPVYQNRWLEHRWSWFSLSPRFGYFCCDHDVAIVATRRHWFSRPKTTYPSLVSWLSSFPLQIRW